MKTIRVLVPLDGSALSRGILPLVRDLGQPAVTLLRVVDDRLFGPPPEGPRALPGAVERDIAWQASHLKYEVEGLDDVRAIVREGNAAEEILNAASQLAMGLIAMTTHGRSGFDRLVLGSVAEKVIRASPVPVLVANAGVSRTAHPRNLFDAVLVPYDGSELAWRAIETLAILREPGKTKITLLGVVETFGESVTSATHHLAREFTELRTEGMREELQRAASRARDLGFEASVDVEAGSPAAKILDRAAALPATLIAMGTHGRSGPARWALGSVTEKVLRASTSPLLICR